MTGWNAFCRGRPKINRPRVSYTQKWSSLSLLVLLGTYLNILQLSSIIFIQQRISSWFFKVLHGSYLRHLRLHHNLHNHHHHSLLQLQEKSPNGQVQHHGQYMRRHEYHSLEFRLLPRNRSRLHLRLPHHLLNKKMFEVTMEFKFTRLLCYITYAGLLIIFFGHENGKIESTYWTNLI